MQHDAENDQKEIRLNLGCGKTKLPGYTNCDIDKRVNPDKIVDLTKRLPFKTNSIEHIYTSHTLEHIDKETLVNTTLPEIWRICKPNVTVKIIVPYMDSQNVLNHKTRFNKDTFSTICKENYTSSESYPFKFSFELKKFEYGVSNAWRMLYYLIPLDMWHGLWSHLIAECRAELVVRK